MRPIVRPGGIQVDKHRAQIPVAGRQLPRKGLALIVQQVAKDDVRAFGDQQARFARANSTRGSGDDCDSVTQSLCHHALLQIALFCSNSAPHVDVQRAGGAVAFVNCYLTVADLRLVRASGM